MTTYDPIVLRVDMTDQGYRSVTVSVAPGRQITVTVCREGATDAEARQAALDTISLLPGVGEVNK